MILRALAMILIGAPAQLESLEAGPGNATYLDAGPGNGTHSPTLTFAPTNGCAKDPLCFDERYSRGPGMPAPMHMRADAGSPACRAA